MDTAIKHKLYTFHDFCSIVSDGQKADLINGAIYMASPDNTDAADLGTWLGTLWDGFVREKDLGKVFGSRVAYRLSDHCSPEPDLSFIRKDRYRLILRGFVNGSPDAAVEIVSPDSIERDYHVKRQLYEEHGVSEYWIIDEIKEKVTLLRLGRDGKYREVRPRKGVLHSKVIAGFWLRIEWLWQRPRPKPLQILQELVN